MSNSTINLNAIETKEYVSTKGVKTFYISGLIDGQTKTKIPTVKLECVSECENPVHHYEEFHLSPYGFRQMKKFIDKTEMFSPKQLETFHHNDFLGKRFSVEFFETKNRNYDSTNPNSKLTYINVGNDTYTKPTSNEPTHGE